MTATEEIRASLFSLRDEPYRALQITTIPTVPPDTIIGVRTPQLRKMAKQLAQRPDIDAFLRELPHRYFEENQLHAFLIAEIRPFEACLEAVSRFLPYVDNWATCDQLSPKVFRISREQLIPVIRRWIDSGATYTVRFGVGMLMAHFLDEAFDPAYPAWVAGIRSDAYYVRMMVAWYFATALAKQYEAALPYIEDSRLDVWTHNKAIQKAIESYRVPPERKAYLRGLKRKKASDA